MRRERHGRRHISALNHLHGIRTSQPKFPADVVAAEIHKWYEVTRILNASPHDWCPPVPNAAWVEQQASVRLPCQRAERHRALLVAHPVPNALRHTLCPTPLGWRPCAASQPLPNASCRALGACATLVDTPKKVWCYRRLCDVAGHDIAMVTSLGSLM